MSIMSILVVDDETKTAATTRLYLEHVCPFAMRRSGVPGDAVSRSGLWGEVCRSRMEKRIPKAKVEFNPLPATISFITARKMGLRWWRDVLIQSRPKRYVDDR